MQRWPTAASRRAIAPVTNRAPERI
jgi:hypothetical protein